MGSTHLGFELDYNSHTVLIQFSYILSWRVTVFTRLNAPGVYLKLCLIDPAFVLNRRLIGSRRLLTECNFLYFLKLIYYFSFLRPALTTCP